MTKRPVDSLEWGRDSREKFLLSIIDAYPIAKRDRQVRLDEAKKALFGEEPTSKTKKKFEDDDWFLMQMAHLYLKDRMAVWCTIEKKWKKDPKKPRPRSVSELAREAAARAPHTWGTNAVERLRKKFAANKKGYLAAELHGDDAGSEQDYSALKKVKEILEFLGIAMNIEHAAKSMHPATKKLDVKE